MRTTLRILVVFLILFAFDCHADQFKAVGTIDVYFSPEGGATDAIVNEIDNAKSEIIVQAYSFTSKPIAKALLIAKKRGVAVIAVLDKSQRKGKYTEADFISHAGIPTLLTTTTR